MSNQFPFGQTQAAIDKDYQEYLTQEEQRNCESKTHNADETRKYHVKMHAALLAAIVIAILIVLMTFR